MRRLGVRVGRVATLRPPPPPPPVDPSRLTPAQLERAGELQERFLAVGLSGLTDDELDEVIALRALLTAPRDGEG